MTNTPRREDVVERLLRRVTTSPSEAGGGCPDAEVLGAWVDHELAHPLRDTVDLHVAGCERCQMITATMARMAPAEEVAAVAATGRWLRWLIPVAAAAAVLVFWLIAPGRFPVNQPAKTGEQAELGNVGAPAPPAPPPSADEVSRATPPVPPVARMEDKKAAAPPARMAQAPVPAPALPAAREVSANAPEALAKTTDLLSMALEFQTPDGAVRWRLRASVPERSADAGVTWTSLPTGVDATLVAGAAPDASTCWLVGRGGVVLRRTGDGAWTRVSFPEVADLASIRATDARHASVTTADGRLFETADGGETWVRRAPQGNPAPTF